MFFETERQNFFRPLNGKRRELVAACLQSLYERLHGPGADYSQNLNRDSLRDVLMPAIREHAAEVTGDGLTEDDDLASIDSNDVQLLAGALIRSLLKDGWLETFGDRVGLVTAYRLTRAGKLFAEALWSLSRLRTRSRQRNVRGCRNALEAALKNVDAYDVVDAYDYAERVISDLSEGVDYFQELVRRLMSEASRTSWDEFIEFLDRFEKDFKKQMTSDNVERHRQAIRGAIHKLRSIEQEKFDALEAQLRDIASWANADGQAESTFDWMLDRVEEMVEAACTTKHPELLKAMNIYVRRATSIVQQAMLLRGEQSRHNYSKAIALVSEQEGDAQAALLHRLGAAIAPAEVRLLDPASFKLRSTSQRRKALAVTVKPRVTRESRLAAAMHRAEAGAFALSNNDVLEYLRRELRLRNRALRLSSLPVTSATDVLTTMQAVEAIRSYQDTDVKASKLPTRLINKFYTADDFLIEFDDEPDNRRA
ncbi:Wadjet anti-phage system protein JetA family protein [Ralstonia pickettii]|uniref:Wadjet anti-phage system protein JetA family protein n=1 Tax=Ralstonia pickettii TaxID=329 RepID=UPI0015F9911F|nr:Wadjet anti-phage system protein JetA family protein [Ralstonia pickettii]MBB0026143.1 ferrochelatase [Ralstonia pickettii]MBB0036800.1 ferrochelatase [Ralstonia pickettii]MBB0099340.1 ferrochelatase [Ralstonia pickettii]MBB0109135.1 ferrochelatase [Ralstonia pickettii]MBB0130114.1 ferrochelatase [Ralstonia pickettii]